MLKRNINEESINKIFEPILNIKVNNEQIQRIINEYNNEKFSFKPYVSIFEFGTSKKKLFNKNLKNEQFIISFYSSLTYELNENINDKNLLDSIKIWLNNNSKNKTIPKIILLDTQIKGDKNLALFVSLLIKLEEDKKKNFFIMS